MPPLRLRLTVLESRETPAVFTVTTASGDPAASGSLPAAVALANATPGFDRIHFAISGDGPHTIAVSQPLVVTDQVAVLGDTQPGFNPLSFRRPVISVTGGAAVPNLFVLEGNGAGTDPLVGSTLQNLSLLYYTDSAIDIRPGSTGNWIQENWVGHTVEFAPGGARTVRRTDALYPAPAFQTTGVEIRSDFNVVRNNAVNGVANGVVVGDPTAGSGVTAVTNSVQMNLIGLNADGWDADGYGNTADGILLMNGAQQNFVGPANTVSNNGGNGVAVLGPTAGGNVVIQNRIGTGNGFDAPRGNGGYGVLVGDGATGTIVGGPGDGNAIADNARGGVAVGTADHCGAPWTRVVGNIIGLNSTQDAVPGSQPTGVVVGPAGPHRLAFSRPIVIESNVIAGHTLHGVTLDTAEGVVVGSNHFGESAIVRRRFETIRGTRPSDFIQVPIEGSEYRDQLPNGGYGVVVTATVVEAGGAGNFPGSNALGPLYRDPAVPDGQGDIRFV